MQEQLQNDVRKDNGKITVVYYLTHDTKINRSFNLYEGIKIKLEGIKSFDHLKDAVK